MDKKTEAKFEQIAADTLVRAENVRCEPEDYVEGLRVIILEVKERCEGSCEEFGVEPRPFF